MRKLLAMVALATTIMATTPAFAQACDPDVGTGSLSGVTCQGASPRILVVKWEDGRSRPYSV
jgi:hypothetical protein